MKFDQLIELLGEALPVPVVTPSVKSATKATVQYKWHAPDMPKFFNWLNEYVRQINTTYALDSEPDQARQDTRIRKIFPQNPHWAVLQALYYQALNNNSNFDIEELHRKLVDLVSYSGPLATLTIFITTLEINGKVAKDYIWSGNRSNTPNNRQINRSNIGGAGGGLNRGGAIPAKGGVIKNIWQKEDIPDYINKSQHTIR